MAKPFLYRARQLAARFKNDHSGVAAIEFAFMVPLLLTLYIGSMEASQAIDTNKKVGRTASMVGDLVTQQSSVDKSMLEGIMQIGTSLMRPYTRSFPTIRVTAIEINDASEAKEVWWRELTPNAPAGLTFATSGAMPANQAANPAVPASLLVADSFLVRVTASMPYKLVLTYSNEEDAGLFGISGFFNGISMSETYYLRPRVSDKITCSDC